jgi:predicted Zn-dependent protease
MRAPLRHAFASISAFSLLACGTPAAPPERIDTAEASRAAPHEPPPDARPLDGAGLYLQPNAELPDGSLAFVHVTEADMPLRIAIGLPPSPAKYASSEETRAAAIEAMQMWERAIQPRVPWFRLEFVEKDPDAPVQVKWKRRIAGPWAGFGEIQHWRENGDLRVGGRMQISTTPSQFYTLDVDEVRLLVAHEFGHVLGLGHCHECDSAMNYSWETRDRVIVTDTDVRTFEALVAQPNLTPAAELAGGPANAVVEDAR